MRIRIPQSRPARLKLVLSLCVLAVGAQVLLIILNTTSLLFSDLYNKTELFYLTLLTTTRLLAWIAPVLGFLGMWHIQNLKIFSARRQYAATVVIQAILVYSFAFVTPFALAALETIFRSTFALNSYHFFNEWIYNNQWFMYGSGYISQLWWTAWIVLLCPPSFRLKQWSPKRERVCRIIGITLCAMLLCPSIAYYIHRLNPFDFVNDPYSRITTFLRHMGIFIQWGIPAATFAALVFLIHLRRNAYQLVFDPNHCSSCDYPLDQSMTTCPECGVSRSLPLPSGERASPGAPGRG